jgi:hypothetical protein
VSNANVHIINAILYADRPPMRFLRYFLLAALLLMGLLGLRFAFLSLAPPGVYMKDFIQEYLLAQAVVNGVNPYLPLPELADRFIGPLENPIFPHPTPHPPPVILLSVPLALISYERAALVWLLFEIVCFSGSIYLILGWRRQAATAWPILLTTVVVMGWGPVVDGLVVGQLMSLLLLLLCAAWRLWRRDQWITGAILLGMAAALKLIVWPLTLLFLLYRQWRALAAFLITFIGANLLAGLLVGGHIVAYYYTTVGAEVEAIYRAHEENFAIWGLGWRLFVGTGSPFISGIQAPPLLLRPELAIYSSTLILLLFLSFVLLACLKTSRFEARLAILISAAVVASPIAWSHYLILLIIPFAIIGRYLSDLEFPRSATNWAGLLLLLMLWPRSELQRLVRLFAAPELGSEIFPAVPFAASLITLAPLLAVLSLPLFILYLEGLAIRGYE